MFARIFLIVSLFASTLHAESLDEKLQSVKQRLKLIEVQAGEELDLKELSDLALELEIVIAEMRQLEREYTSQSEDTEQEFYEESEELMAVLGYIATFESQPAPDFLLHPQGPLASVRANIIAQSLMEDLQLNVAGIAERLQGWRRLQAQEEALNEVAQKAFDDVNAMRSDLIAVDRGEKPKREVEEPMVLDALYAVSENLDDFLTGLSEIDVKGAPEREFSMEAQKGTLELPVRGETIKHRKGIQVLTNDHFVPTPIPGTVRFRANFLDYGNMVVIEPETNHLVIFAGLDAIAVEEGEVIEKGDIIGFFSEQRTPSDGSDVTPLRLPKRYLYVETRINNEPVDVMDYFRRKAD